MLLGCLYLARNSQSEHIPLRESLATLPLRIGVWQGENLPNFDSKVEAVLGVDEYANRYYRHKSLPPVSLYIGYYQSQRQGDTMHSPLNCLPGAGWEPIHRERIKLSVPGDAGEPPIKQVEINRLIIQKGLERQVVLYWYQSHNRVIASEYLGKIYTVLDAIRYNRTDAALIRIISPIANTETEKLSEQAATEFAEAILPIVSSFLPASDSA
jgi:EpsI family protein